MRVKIAAESVALWLSASDTLAWSNKPGARWPCSTVANHRLAAVFDRGGLVELVIDGGRNVELDGNESSACMADHLAEKLPKDHPARFVAVDQYRKES